MGHTVLLKCFEPIEPGLRDGALQLLQHAGIEPLPQREPCCGLGLVLLSTVSSEALDWLQYASRDTAIVVIALTRERLPVDQIWRLMAAGACDVFVWREWPDCANAIAARFDHLREVRDILSSPAVQQHAVGSSACWRGLLREIVEVGAFTDASVLIMGESGTGKELLAQLIHELDSRPDRGDLVVLDCAAMTPELSGSEFFGHERGAFTGAVNAREGAFALANGGTLFLDEIGELPLPLQAQLLRAVQEHKYKRVGSNHWQHTQFRLVCATNRNLEACVNDGHFRSDLYHRIAGWVCRVPPLRERPDDILSLAEHFLSHLNQTESPPPLDYAVQQYLLARSYPGNVRELRQLVTRIWHRHKGSGAITPGDIPQIDRPVDGAIETPWLDSNVETALRHALQLGIGLKEINRVTAETAIRLALEQEQDNVHRAARLLGVTDRAVQLRRASRRPLH